MESKFFVDEGFVFIIKVMIVFIVYIFGLWFG